MILKIKDKTIDLGAVKRADDTKIDGKYVSKTSFLKSIKLALYLPEPNAYISNWLDELNGPILLGSNYKQDAYLINDNEELYLYGLFPYSPEQPAERAFQCLTFDYMAGNTSLYFSIEKALNTGALLFEADYDDY